MVKTRLLRTGLFLGLAFGLACGRLDEFELARPCAESEPRCHNRAPVLAEPRIHPTEPSELDDLECVLAAPPSDPDGDALRLSYAWTRNDEPTAFSEVRLGREALLPGERWACTVSVTDGLLAATRTSPTALIGAAGPRALAAWLSWISSGWCCAEYNRFLNLCGDVEFCFDPRVMRTYPEGFAVDVGLHWDGEPGVLLDVGGDCDEKRVNIWLGADGSVNAESFMSSEALRGRIEPGPHLISYVAGPTRSALFVDGELAQEVSVSERLPELLGACGPGFVVGQRLSYWWEANKRDRWLRAAPFLVHLRTLEPDASDFRARDAVSAGPRTVAFFDAAGVSEGAWHSHDQTFTASTAGAAWVQDVGAECFVGNRSPRAPGVAIEPPAPREGEALRCDVVAPSVDGDGDLVRYDFAWLRDGEPTAHEAATLPAGETRAFERWTCLVTPSDPTGPGTVGGAGVNVRAWPPCHAIALTATSASLRVENVGYDLGPEPWTVELWTRISDRSGPLRDQRILSMNEAHGDAGLFIGYEATTGRVFCATGPDGTRADGARIDDREWHHVACGYDGVTLRAWTDGRPSAGAEGSATFQARSPLALGRALGHLAQPAAQVDLGPWRVSRSGRYEGRFAPAKRWSVDEHAISQHLVSQGLVGDTLVDEAGGDNVGVVRSGVVALDEIPCRP